MTISCPAAWSRRFQVWRLSTSLGHFWLMWFFHVVLISFLSFFLARRHERNHKTHTVDQENKATTKWQQWLLRQTLAEMLHWLALVQNRFFFLHINTGGKKNPVIPHLIFHLHSSWLWRQLCEKLRLSRTLSEGSDTWLQLLLKWREPHHQPIVLLTRLV